MRCYLLSVLLRRRPPITTLLPYTTLFRSRKNEDFLEKASLFYYVEFDAESKETIPFQGKDYAFKPTGKNTGTHERSEEHTSELQSRENLVCRLLLEKKKRKSRKSSMRPRL